MIKNKKINLTKIEIIGFAFLLIELLLIFIANLTCSAKYVDCDTAKLFEHIIKMWEHKTLTIDQWFYSTTIEWDCTTIFALPIYGLTKNIFLACSISNLLLTLIFVYTIFFIFRGYSKIYPLGTCSIILLPWALGMLDYYNMMFFAGTQYIVKVTVPLMFIGLILCIEKEDMAKWWKKKDFMFMLILFLFFFFTTTASSSIYVTVSGIAPIVLTLAVYKLFNWSRVKSIYYIIAPLMLVLLVLGYVINANVLGGTRGDGITYIEVHSVFNNFQEGLMGMFELFGGTTIYDDTKVMSYYGIAQFFKFLFVLFLLGNAFISLGNIFKKKSNLLKSLLTAVFFWNWLILILTLTQAGSATFEYRYHLIGMIPLMILSVTNLIDLVKGCKVPNNVMAYISYVLLTVAILFCYKETLFWGEQNPNIHQIVDYFKDSDYDRIYIYIETNESDKLRLFGNPRHYIDIMDDGKTWAYDFYKYYKDGEIFPEGSALIIRTDFYPFKDTDVFHGYNIEKIDQVGCYTVYLFSDYIY